MFGAGTENGRRQGGCGWEDATLLFSPMSARKPHEIHHIFEAAFNAGDLEAIMALYEPGAVFHSRGQVHFRHDASGISIESLFPLDRA